MSLELSCRRRPGCHYGAVLDQILRSGCLILDFGFWILDTNLHHPGIHQFNCDSMLSKPNKWTNKWHRQFHLQDVSVAPNLWPSSTDQLQGQLADTSTGGGRKAAAGSFRTVGASQQPTDL